jgi:hypothetical protein
VADDELQLAPGTRLLHIGPHKTGTTAIQRALQDARQELRAKGVVYPGRGPSHIRAACAVVGVNGLIGAPPPHIRAWERLVKEVDRAGDRRVVISSEFFDMADDVTARRVVEALGGDRVHVVVTLRPLAKILPSAWQQAVRSNLATGYGRWLRRIFREPVRGRHYEVFWYRHSHDALIRRWADIVGPDRLTVVVLDETDRDMLLHTFERMLALPRATLSFVGGGTNRGLTRAETELVLRINRLAHKRKWSRRAYGRYMRLGVIRHLQVGRVPPSDEPRIETPRWALQRAAEIGSKSAAAIRASGVRVVGDLESLGAEPDGAGARTRPLRVLPVKLAVEAVVGAIEAGIETAPAAVVDAGPASPRPEDRLAAQLTSRELAGLLARRVRRRVRRPGQ